MTRRHEMGRRTADWSSFCEWFLRRAPFPAERSYRLLSIIARLTGLPKPVVLRVQR